MFDGARSDAQCFGHVGDFPGVAEWSGIAQQQRAGMDKRGGRCLAAARQTFQSTALIFAECNSITGCHSPIIHQETPGVNMRNSLCYVVLGWAAMNPANLLTRQHTRS